MSLTTTQEAWVRARMARRVATVELPAHNGLPAVYLATDRFVARGTLNAVFEPRILGEIRLRRAIRSRLMGGGSSETSISEIRIAEPGGSTPRLDITGWTDRPAIIRWGNPLWEEIGDHIRVVAAEVAGVDVSGPAYVLSLRPANVIDRKQIPFTRMTTSTGGESAGEAIPNCYGFVVNAPVLVTDAVPLRFCTYGVFSSSSIAATFTVKDNNVALTEGVDFTQTTQGTAPNQFREIDLDNVIGTVTFDYSTNAFGNNFEDVLLNVEHDVLNAYGDVISFTGDLDRGLQVGLYVNTPQVLGEVVDELMDSLGAARFLNAAGDIEVTRIEAPSAEAADLVNAADFARASVATRISAAGTLEQVSSGIRRDEHDFDTGELLGTLIEPSSTNLLTNNQTWSGWGTTNLTVTTSSETPPDGSSDADLLNDNSNFPGYRTSPLVPSTTNEYYTYSVWLKEGTAADTDIYLEYFSSASGTDYLHLRLNWSSRTFSIVGFSSFLLFPTFYVEHDDGDWLRVVAVARARFADATNMRVRQYAATTTGSDKGTVHVWRPQIEERYGATSTIFTNGSAVTRVADEWKVDGTKFGALWRQGQGTLLVDFYQPRSSVISPTIAAVDDATANNRLEIIRDGGASVDLDNGGVEIGSVAGTTSGLFERVRVAVGWSGTELDLAADGTLSAGDTFSASLNDWSQIFLGSMDGANGLSGVIRAMHFWPEKLSDEKLIQLSAGLDPTRVRGARGKPFTQDAEPFRFSKDNVVGGASSQLASRPTDALVLGIRNSWADSGDDVIDPALEPKDKVELRRAFTHVLSSASESLVAAQKFPVDYRPIPTLLTDSGQAFAEGLRWNLVLSRVRQFYRWTALQGAALIEPGQATLLAHAEIPGLGPLRDDDGEVILDPNFEPMQEGVMVLVKTLEESLPSGRVTVEGWG